MCVYIYIYIYMYISCMGRRIINKCNTCLLYIYIYIYTYTDMLTAGLSSAFFLFARDTH